MKTTHTPAPWQLSNATSAGRFIGSGPDGVLGIAMAFGDSPDEQDANARLIAAAPDLLKELKDMVRVWENGWKVDRDVYLFHARAAIAKAEGAQ